MDTSCKLEEVGDGLIELGGVNDRDLEWLFDGDEKDIMVVS